jgi:DNA-binding MarR family transcriptional regulator
MRLTVRQSAVLAAIERRRECTLLDLNDDFPDLDPSTVYRVIESLCAKSLVNREGDFDGVFLGELTFLPTRLGEPSYDLPL